MSFWHQTVDISVLVYSERNVALFHGGMARAVLWSVGGVCTRGHRKEGPRGTQTGILHEHLLRHLPHQVWCRGEL